MVEHLEVLEVGWGSHIGEATSMIHSGKSTNLIRRSVRVQLRAGQKVAGKEFRVLP